MPEMAFEYFLPTAERTVICNHLSGVGYDFDLWGWIVVAVLAIYVAAIFRLDLWLYEKGLRWHSDGDMDYANVFNPNPQKLVSDHQDKIKKKSLDDKNKNEEIA